MRHKKLTNRLKSAVAVITGLGISFSSSAFTQYGVGGTLPMGHEWLTRTSALDILEAEHIIEADPLDPRVTWTNGLAKNIDLSNAQDEVSRIKNRLNNNTTYEPRYEGVYAAIIGERWVDTAGFNVATSTVGQVNCFNAVAQEPADVQQDHFMRRYDDIGGQGGVDAAKRGQERFINHFVNAAMANEKSMKAWDGGGYSALYKVDHNYFLFGRAVHLFQDSFSPEHTVRLAEDNYEKVRQVKAFLCSEGAEQHTHETTAALDFSSGDVVWKENTRLDSGWSTYKVSSMKPVALVALEASKDLWAAFIRSMATPYDQRRAVALAEAQTLVNNWLSFDEQEMLSWYDEEDHRDHTYVLAPQETGKGMSLFDCMVGLGIESGSQQERVQQLEQDRRMCLYNIEAADGFADLNDPYMQIPFNWAWTSSEWQTPPADWTIPQLTADTGDQVTLINVLSGDPVVTDEGLVNNASLYSKSGDAVEFIIAGDKSEGAYFRARHNADLFLSFAYSGRSKLYNSADQAAYKVQPVGNLWTLENTYWNDFLWYSGRSDRLYLTGTGDAEKQHSQWIINEVAR